MRSFLGKRKLKILKDQLVPNICAERQQSDGDFRDYAGLFIFDKGVIATDINYRTKHDISSEKPPRSPGAVADLELKD